MLSVYNGDIWDLSLKYWLVIPTNIGWKKDGDNVMGAGLAKQAAQRYAELTTSYGKKCREELSKEPDLATFLPRVNFKHNLILFPTKRLNLARPHASWQSKSDLGLIEGMLKVLSTYTMHIAVPLLGCENGGLQEEEVRPLLEAYLGEKPNFLLVIKG